MVPSLYAGTTTAVQSATNTLYKVYFYFMIWFTTRASYNINSSFSLICTVAVA